MSAGGNGSLREPVIIPLVPERFFSDSQMVKIKASKATPTVKKSKASKPSAAQLAARAAGAIRLKAAAAARKSPQKESRSVVSPDLATSEIEKHRRRQKELKKLEPKPMMSGKTKQVPDKNPFVLYV